MATQEFLGGGFIGKMGNLVGQHWHNKRYVRSYVIPIDPKTPEQMSNRARFARAIKLMQQANMLNSGDASWITTARGESQLRTGTATSRLIAGKRDAEALPLFPDNWQKDTAVRGGSAIFDGDPGNLTVTSTNPIIYGDRLFFVLLHCYNRENNQWFDVMREQLTPTGTKFAVTIPDIATASMPSGAYLIATTQNNSAFNSDSFTLLMVPVGEPAKPYYTVTLSLKEIKPDSEGDAAAYFTSDKYLDTGFFEITIQVRGWRIGAGWETVNWNIYRNETGILQAWIYEDEQIEYPAGAKILAGDDADTVGRIDYHTNEQAFKYP